MRKKLLIVFGTRPELIKLAPIYHQLLTLDLDVRICSTGQHRDLILPLLDLFNIRFDYELNLMDPSQSNHRFMSRCILELGQLMTAVQPDFVMVQGDTNSALAGAITAFQSGSMLLHVEAGLRSHNLREPFPEEGNRKLISQIASFHFSPTEHARDMLLQEGISEHVYVTGNTVIDSLMHTVSHVEEQETAILMRYNMQYNLDFSHPFMLITTHRRESIASKLSTIYAGIIELAQQNPEMNFVIILHPNPNVQAAIRPFMNQSTNCFFIDPLPYQECCLILSKCYAVITDSGGIQEEAPSLNKPVMVVRDQTERSEGIEAGCLVQVGTCSDQIVSVGNRMILDTTFYQKMVAAPNPFGDGKSAERIQAVLNSVLVSESVLDQRV